MSALGQPPFPKQDEVTLRGYKSHLVGKDAEAPLTVQEEELKEVNKVDN